MKTHRVASDGVLIDLWQAMPQPIAAGDTFTVTAGCDKRFATCRDRFANGVNFRGFPHIPGNDFVTSYAVQGGPGNDGLEPDDGGMIKPMTLTRCCHRRRGAGLDRHALSPPGLAQGRRLRLPRPGARRLARADRRRARAVPAYAPRLGGGDQREALADAGIRHFAPVELAAIEPGDVLLFRWRAGLPAKHAAIVSAAALMVHAHSGAAVAEVAIAPWWRRRLALPSGFPE